MEQLRDIKGLVEVTDYSLYYLLGLIALGLLIVLILGFYIYKRVYRKRAMTQQKLAKKLLKQLEIDDAKESAYAFSHLAQYAVDETQRARLQELLDALEVYKYKKEVPQLDPALKKKMQTFIGEVSRG